MAAAHSASRSEQGFMVEESLQKIGRDGFVGDYWTGIGS